MLLPKILVICCFKVFLGWQKKGELYVCVARTISAISETCWGHRTATCAVVLTEKKKTSPAWLKQGFFWGWKMNTVKVVGLDEGVCWVLATLCVISIEVDWWCHFEAAYDSARDFNCCAACDRKGPVRLLLRLYCRQQSIQEYSIVFFSFYSTRWNSGRNDSSYWKLN